MPGPLAAQVAVITGAASGMGRASALLFAERGARIVVADIDVLGGEATVAHIHAQHGDAIFVQCDVTVPRDLELLVTATTRAYGRIDIVHGNAGILRSSDTIETASIEDWQRTMDINLNGQFYLAKAVHPHLIAKGGAVVFTASRRSFLPLSHGLAYAASKFGLLSLTRGLAELWKKEKIRVNCVCPGAVATSLLRYRAGQDIPLGPTTLDPMEVAHLVYDLATDEESNGKAVFIERRDGKPTYALVGESSITPLELPPLA